MLKRIDHVAIVVRNLEEGLKLYEDLFGIKPSKIETLPEQGVRAALLPFMESEIELIEPIDPNSGVAKFLESRGEGIHHLCLEVDDVDKELDALASKGVALIDKKGRRGLAGKIGFIHPRSTKGTLIELAQKVEEAES
jgi:lactoylglutathione lyase/methylmalonyl-CoA/ethylmalonyl-CoA epimerase